MVPSEKVALHPGSFRDPGSAILVWGNHVFRAFTGRGRVDFQAVLGSGLLDRLVTDGLVVPYDILSPRRLSDLSQTLPSDGVVIEHPKLPFVSYVYEWPFGMLKAAALLHLEVLGKALEAGFVLKDASAYNVQFVGPKPVFIDLGSFAPYEDGQPWQAYAQFCRMFLNPLLLYSLTGTRYHWWMRSSLEGIAPNELSPLLSLRHKVRPPVFIDVVLQALLQKRFASLTVDQIGIKPHVSKQSVLRRINGLRATISALKSPTGNSVWTSYEETNSYSNEARAQKAALIENQLARARPKILWDLGSNQGQYSSLASQYADTVVAMDNDADIVELIYQRVRGRYSNILPLVMDVLNPSPDQGWGERERQGLMARGKADFVLALALIHHLRITGNIPIHAFVSWLAKITRNGIVEFVPKSDPMLRRLLAWRADIYDDYSRLALEAALLEHFRLTQICQLSGSERILYAFEAK